MKRTIIYLIFMILPISAFCQKKIENAEELMKKIEKTAASTKSIESDFKQIKHMDIFDSDITSFGNFYYKAENKISLSYTKPLLYKIVINENKLMIDADGKKNIMSLNDNKLMGEMKGMLTACMTGNFSNVSKDYRMDFYETGEHYLVTVSPINETIKTYIAKFDIYLNKKDLSVDKLRLSETETDYTEYFFSNKKFNSLTNDDKFLIK